MIFTTHWNWMNSKIIFNTHRNWLNESEILFSYKASLPLENSGHQLVDISPVQMQVVRNVHSNIAQACLTFLIRSASLSRFSSISHSQPSQFMCSKLISELNPSKCLTFKMLLEVEREERWIIFIEYKERWKCMLDWSGLIFCNYEFECATWMLQ